MSELREAVNTVIEGAGNDGASTELEVQRVIAYALLETLLQHLVKLDQIISEVRAL